MISKERLEELIEQGATIYKIRDNMIVDYQLCSYNYLEYNDLIYENVLTNYCRNWIGKLDDLFETEEDARWELEMTATRTETLKLPTYEKVFEQDRCLDCYTKEFAITKTDIVIGICLFGVDFTNKVIEVSVGADKMFIGKLTKENYIEACKLCLRLFKGEEV